MRLGNDSESLQQKKISHKLYARFMLEVQITTDSIDGFTDSSLNSAHETLMHFNNFNLNKYFSFTLKSFLAHSVLNEVIRLFFTHRCELLWSRLHDTVLS